MRKHIAQNHLNWISDFPSNWKIKRYKQIFEERDEKSEKGDETLLSVSALTGISPRSELIDEGDFISTAKSLAGYKRCYPKDLVMNIMLAWNKGLAISKYEGIVSPAYAVFKIKSDDNPDYLNYLIRDEQTNLYFKSYSKGIIDSRLRLYSNIFLQLYCVLPDLETQNKIVQFLNEKTSKIQNLFNKYNQLIGFFNDRINTLVLDEIKNPKTQYIRLQHACHVVSRPISIKIDNNYTQLGLLNRGRGIFFKDECKGNEMGDSNFFLVKQGDLILSGQFAWEGAVAKAEADHEGCVVSHRYPIIKGKDEVALTEYLLGLLTSSYGDFIINENSRGSAGRNKPLNMSLLLKEKIPIIDYKIQEKIKLLINSKQYFLKKTKEQIKLIMEYQNSLINSAIKGKLNKK